MFYEILWEKKDIFHNSIRCRFVSFDSIWSFLRGYWAIVVAMVPKLMLGDRG